MCQYLFNSTWLKTIKDKNIFLLFDFDGTLVPISKNPDACYLSDEIKKILESLKTKIKIGIISGRDLNDLKKRVAIDGIYYSGSHGLQIKGNGVNYINLEAKMAKPLINRIYKKTAEIAQNFEGIFIEKKDFSFTLHYRNTVSQQRKDLKKLFFQILREYDQQKIRVLKGKMVFEVMPAIDWDKGKATLFMINSIKKEVFPIFLGDDITDETVFKAIKDIGITVRVGISRNTQATYCLRTQKEVYKFLLIVQETLND